MFYRPFFNIIKIKKIFFFWIFLSGYVLYYYNLNFNLAWHIYITILSFIFFTVLYSLKHITRNSPKRMTPQQIVNFNFNYKLINNNIMTIIVTCPNCWNVRKRRGHLLYQHDNSCALHKCTRTMQFFSFPYYYNQFRGDRISTIMWNRKLYCTL